MGYPRSKYYQEGEEGVFHCTSRCVRRAYLCGFDKLTQRDYSHRKAWILEKLRNLTAVFAIEVCAYAILATHYHTILWTRPDIVARWSDEEVATRWLTLYPPHRKRKRGPIPSIEEEVHALVENPERIAELRQRLCSLSWFMKQLNESIARDANKEDGVKGRFWESRFNGRKLLDEAAIATCMVYVDLNSIRAGLAETPEESDFTSIQERIRAWQRDNMPAASVPKATQVASVDDDIPVREAPGEVEDFIPDIQLNSCDDTTQRADWLCPIQSDSKRRGILQMTEAEYFDLVDRSGRLMRSDKRGAIDAGLKPILLRIGANPDAWQETISDFGSEFHIAAGLLSSLRSFADRIGSRWIKGVAAARAAFLSSPPQLV